MKKHLLDPMDLTLGEIDNILLLAERIIKNPEKYNKVCKNKKLATLFFEPSTRTRLSFEAAMLELGGNVLGFATAESSSTAKGESISDTVRTVACYSDIIALRHPKEGAAVAASKKLDIPIINAGDGGHQHPTQTLTDLLTVKILKGSLNNLTIGMCGDLKFGRTVHSLIRALSRYKNIQFIFISPRELKVPRYIKEDVLKHNTNVSYTQYERLENIISKLDILYMTRVQRERFFNEEDYVRLKDSYILDNDKMRLAKPDMIVMHPLPRLSEISTEVDDDPRAVYFQQALFGKYVRMALIMTLLNLEEPC